MSNDTTEDKAEIERLRTALEAASEMSSDLWVVRYIEEVLST